MDGELPSRTADLQFLYCWVCSEEQTTSASERGQAGDGGAQVGRSKFVHPCKCSLVAHEKVCWGSCKCFKLTDQCLLSWIRQCRRNRPDEVIRCPQCKEVYILDQPQPIVLELFQQCSRYVSAALPFGAAVLTVGGAMVTATAYGCLAVRLFLGPSAARRALAPPWPWHVRTVGAIRHSLQFWFDLPLIPFALVASRLPILANFSTWLPTLVALPVTSVPTPLHSTFHLYRLSARLVQPRRYPPNPLLTVRPGSGCALITV